MKVLSLETSGRCGSLAAINANGPDSAVLESHQLPADLRTAQTLLSGIEKLLAQSDWSVQELDLVCVACGPGSFTGLRIGVTVAKTLAYATGAALVGVNTLAAMAAGVDQPFDRLWCILNAQREELFTVCFPREWQVGSASHPETQILSIEQWLSQLRAGDTVCGSTVKALGDRLPAEARVLAGSYGSAHAIAVGQIGISAMHLGDTIDPMQLVPQYYRKSAAEEKANSGDGPR